MEKWYRLEARFAIIETDEHGRWSGNNRFELQDSQQLEQLPLPRMLEIMSNLHAAFSNITEITNRQDREML